MVSVVPVVVVAMNVVATTHQSAVVWLEVMVLEGKLINCGWVGGWVQF